MAWCYWCILLAGLLPYFATMFAKWGFNQFDNHNPRLWLSNQTGFRARGNAAQANSFEAFPLFAVGVLLANFLQVPTLQINTIASIFVIARFVYILCYVADKATLRSVFWFLGMVCSVSLYILASLQG